MAYESPLTIADVIGDISENRYVLPSIQREFVWSTTQIERLFDSVMQEYPIGAFLFWELADGQNTLYDFYGFLQNYHEKKARHNTKINLSGSDNAVAVLDGQHAVGCAGQQGGEQRRERSRRRERGEPGQPAGPD